MAKNQPCKLTYSYSEDTKKLTLSYSGDANLHSLKKPWSDSLELIKRYHPDSVEIDLDALESYDSAFVHLLSQLKTSPEIQQLTLKSENYTIAKLFNVYDHIEDSTLEQHTRQTPLFETIGRGIWALPQLCSRGLSLFGELLLKTPRLKTFARFFMHELYQAGPKGLSIIALMGFILGIILTFQGAIALAMFGAKSYSVNMVVIAMTREIGPLMTALVVSGRSVAAFASEIGSMNVNQEIDALQTMAIDKTEFLILPKVCAVILTIPLLSLYMLLFSFIGCALIFMTFGYSTAFYMTQLSQSLSLTNLIGGLIKVTIFGAIIAIIGCTYGLKAKQSSSAVGMATTKSVVMSIIMIAIVDGIFAVIFYQLGI